MGCECEWCRGEIALSQGSGSSDLASDATHTQSTQPTAHSSGRRTRSFDAQVIAYTTTFTPNLVLSRRRNRLFFQS